MSGDVGCSGMFGIKLSDYQGKAMRELWEDMQGRYHELMGDEEGEAEMYPGDAWDVIGDEFYDRVVALFEAHGITIPEGTYLGWAGDGDDRPGRCETMPDEVILGFGLFTKPWDYPEMHESFRKAADWHTWVWGG